MYVCVCVNCFGAVLFVLYKSFYDVVVGFGALPNPLGATPSLHSSPRACRDQRHVFGSWVAASLKREKEVEKKKNEKQIYKYFYWEFTSEQNKLDNNSRSSNNATRQTKRMWLYFFFVVFSPNFITGFPWERVDNVTKFQLFAEQLPLLSNSLSPTPPPKPVSVLDRFELFAQFWATASAAARAKAKASKGRASKLHRKITSTCQTHRRPPWPKALRFNAVSPSLSLGIYLSPSLV